MSQELLEQGTRILKIVKSLEETIKEGMVTMIQT